MMSRIAVIGIGNILFGDDGVGVHVLNKLKCEKLPAKVEIVDGGVGGLSLLNLVRGMDLTIFVDALAGKEPGRIHRFTEHDLDTKVKSMLHPASLHDLGLAEMIKIGQAVYPLEMPKKIIVYGIEVKEPKEYSTELSKDVRDSVDQVVKLILKELNANRRHGGDC
jgi:hydrogenase maturation protease